MSDQNERPSSRRSAFQTRKTKVSTRVSQFEELESGYGTAPDTSAEKQTIPSRLNSTSTTMPRSGFM